MVSLNRQRLGFAVVSPILVLWDIDHTLIENHGVNKETYALAFTLLTGRAGADVVLPDLRDTRAVAEAVTSLAG